MSGSGGVPNTKSTGALARLLNSGVIGPQDQVPIDGIPVPLILAGQDGELGGQCVVEPLYQTVTLKM